MDTHWEQLLVGVALVVLVPLAFWLAYAIPVALEEQKWRGPR